MPGPPPPPPTRTLLYRKVHMRLAALGLKASHISGALFSDASERNRSLFFNRLMKGRYRCTEERRRRLEDLLSLPIGALADETPIGVVGCVPIPEKVLPEPATSPESDDVQPDGAFASTGETLQIAGRSLEAVGAVLASITPSDLHADVDL